MPPIQKYKISHPYLDISCGLGEAPFYEKSHNSLRFVDIVKKKLHTINLDGGVASHREFDLEFSIGTTADVEGVEGKFVFGGEVFSILLFFFFGGVVVLEGLIVAWWWWWRWQRGSLLKMMLIMLIVTGKSGYGVFERETGKHWIIKEMWSDAEKKDDGGGKPSECANCST